MLCDKDYVETIEGLIFNVIGYEHPAGRVLANLKYVEGQKWTRGYQQGLEYLQQHHSAYVDEFVSVPLDRVKRCYYARDGLKTLRAKRAPSSLEATCVELSESLADRLAIPLDQFGVTDSLLWGGANEQSDIDLVVTVNDADNDLLARLPDMYGDPRFERLGRRNFSRDASKVDSASAVMRHRTFHKGLFDGCRFSLRAIRLEPSFERENWVSRGRIQLTSKIVSVVESLFFPVVYHLESGHQVVSYFTEHEGVFREGDQVQVEAQHQQGTSDRLLIAKETDVFQLLGT